MLDSGLPTNVILATVANHGHSCFPADPRHGLTGKWSTEPIGGSQPAEPESAGKSQPSYQISRDQTRTVIAQHNLAATAPVSTKKTLYCNPVWVPLGS